MKASNLPKTVERSSLPRRVREHWWEGVAQSFDNRGLYVVWNDGEGMRLPASWFPGVKRGDYFGCKVSLDKAGRVVAVGGVCMLSNGELSDCD